jgi:hypothetical protein
VLAHRLKPGLGTSPEVVHRVPLVENANADLRGNTRSAFFWIFCKTGSKHKMYREESKREWKIEGTNAKQSGKSQNMRQ